MLKLNSHIVKIPMYLRYIEEQIPLSCIIHENIKRNLKKNC